MRVAALYDIHANLPALEAVLEEVEAERFDTILFGGDLAWGPQPAETLQLVRSLQGALFIRGNADRSPDEWQETCLPPDDLAFLRGLPETLELDGALYCHATPRSDEEIVTPATPDDRLADALAGVDGRVVVAGHTHMQQDRQVGRIRFVNAGSVGLPYEGEVAAFWAAVEGGQPALRKTEVSFDRLVEAFGKSEWPLAEDFLRENVLRPCSREEAIAEFERRAAAEPRA
jgi:putative phosphoesterase